MDTDTKTSLVGRRIALVYTSDPYTRLGSGDEGTVIRVDDDGVIEVKWDSGSGLSLIPSEGDQYRLI